MKRILAVLTFFLVVSGCGSSDESSSSNSSINSTIINQKERVEVEGYNLSFKVTEDTGAYIKILDELDYRNFKIVNNTLEFVNPVIDIKNDYLVKLYIKFSDGSTKVVLYEIIIKKVDAEEGIPVDSDVNTTYTIIRDKDGDYIPDVIENLLGKDPNNRDENSNGIADGLEGDMFFNKQWYIRANSEPMNPSEIPSIEGNDLDLIEVYKSYMGYNNGNPIVIQIVDSGIDSNHEDLKDNFDLAHSLDGAEQGAPTPGGLFKSHGTMLAGIAAARGFNRVGVRGVAPFAKIAGSNWLAKQTLDGLEKAWLTGDGANDIVVSNNSWGKYFTTDSIYEEIMEQGVKTLRDGKGRVYVFASGNSKEEGADANVQYILNNRYALVVGALDYESKAAKYSTPGANVWITAYGGAKNFTEGPTIATTYLSGESTRTWGDDVSKNYTYAMAGSSAAAPMVSAVVGLIVEACPNLTYRDIKYITATTAKKVDPQNSGWVTNSANISFSREYGFGLISAKDAINKCKNGYKNLPPELSVEAIKEVNDEFYTSRSVLVNIDEDLKVEWVEATIDLSTTTASELDIHLISPNGTAVKLLQSGTKVGSYYIPYYNWMNGGFRLSTGAMLDESSVGNWGVKIVNNKSQKVVINSVKIKVYGHKE